jgi:hypothetical protein
MPGPKRRATVTTVSSRLLTTQSVGAESLPDLDDPLAEFFPRPATRTFQSVVIEANAERTYRAIKETDLAASLPVRTLTLLRALPDRALRRLRSRRPQPAARRTIAGLIEAGWWVTLRDEAPTTLALGLVMWDDRVQRQGRQTREVFDLAQDGAVRVGWELRVMPIDTDRSLLVTETMTEPIGEHAVRRFRRYWRLIAPFAGFTRRLVINRIACAAEDRVAEN